MPAQQRMSAQPSLGARRPNRSVRVRSQPLPPFGALLQGGAADKRAGGLAALAEAAANGRDSPALQLAAAAADLAAQVRTPYCRNLKPYL